MATLPGTDLPISPLCLGGNVFGWTADEAASFAVLDAYAEHGGAMVDTADVYSSWVPGHEGGESETIIGRWLASRGRDRVVVATKVGAEGGLGAQNIRERTEACLRRLGTDRIDLLYAHRDDLDTPIEETLQTFGELVREGKVRHIAASNFEPDRLRASLEHSDREGLPRYVALQQHYNLVERDYEGELRDVCEAAGLGTLPYFSLAMGFLTGKYRPGGDTGDSPRAEGAAGYLDARGERVLAVLDELAEVHATTQAAVSLAWLHAQPTVSAPIASARSVEQLEDLLPMIGLELSAEELGRLSVASAA